MSEPATAGNGLPIAKALRSFVNAVRPLIAFHPRYRAMSYQVRTSRRFTPAPAHKLAAVASAVDLVEFAA
jgi:hypothetical protein